MEFDYVPSEGRERTIYQPRIPVTLRYDGREFPVGNALVDTGADVTLIPLVVAKALGVDLATEERIIVGSAGGSEFQAIPSENPIEYVLQQKGFRDIRWRGMAYFVDGQPTVLLGNIGCLEHLNLHFSGPQRKLRVEKGR